MARGDGLGVAGVPCQEHLRQGQANLERNCNGIVTGQRARVGRCGFVDSEPRSQFKDCVGKDGEAPRNALSGAEGPRKNPV